MKNTRSEIELIKDYEKEGYIDTYRFVDGKLMETKNKSVFTPEQIFIVAEHRYEGMTNPSDMSILYIIEAIGGSKGTLLIGYGPTANQEIAEFIKNIPEGNITNLKNLVSK